VLDTVAKMRPGDMLAIGFSRRINVRTQAALGNGPAPLPRSVGYPPDLAASNSKVDRAELLSVPASGQSDQSHSSAQPNRETNARGKSTSASSQRRNYNPGGSQPDDNRRFRGRGLRRR
jgi:hypothetical protein